jgi:hypothetical protein
MPHIEIQDGVLITQRFGATVRVPVPVGGRVEICTQSTHTDVEVRERTGAVHRRFRLPRDP